MEAMLRTEFIVFIRNDKNFPVNPIENNLQMKEICEKMTEHTISMRIKCIEHEHETSSVHCVNIEKENEKKKRIQRKRTRTVDLTESIFENEWNGQDQIYLFYDAMNCTMSD